MWRGFWMHDTDFRWSYHRWKRQRRVHTLARGGALHKGVRFSLPASIPLLLPWVPNKVAQAFHRLPKAMLTDLRAIWGDTQASTSSSNHPKSPILQQKQASLESVAAAARGRQHQQWRLWMDLFLSLRLHWEEQEEFQHQRQRVLVMLPKHEPN